MSTTTTVNTSPVNGLPPKAPTAIPNGNTDDHTQLDVVPPTPVQAVATQNAELSRPPAVSMTTASSSSSASSASGSAGRRTPSQSRRVATVQVVEPSARFVKKRIVICCDGTWEDGLMEPDKTIHTNILRLARAINHDDDRHDIIIPQIVYYQSGIGSMKNDMWTRYIGGATGMTLVDKVAEAYGFIAHNYHPGDEIFLFGFSRGAYTARMVATFIGEIGILDRRDMDHFPEIFVAYQKRGKEDDPKELRKLNDILSKWNCPDARGKQRVDSEHTAFTVKCVGVFDTVGAIGLPKEVIDPLQIVEKEKVFGFNDRLLGAHVERAYHALALNEPRADFDCCRFEQTSAGRDKGQVLKQYWFPGSHGDIGGGWKEHDLSDITLAWMAAEVGDILSIDAEFLQSLPSPVTGWGRLEPHSPLVGIYQFAQTIQRKLPTGFNEKTHEYVHSSALQQKNLLPQLRDTIKANEKILATLLPLEEQVKCMWKWSQEKVAKGEVNSPVEDKSGIGQILGDLGLGDNKDDGKKEKRNSGSPLIQAVKELLSHTPSRPSTPVPAADATPKPAPPPAPVTQATAPSSTVPTTASLPSLSTVTTTPTTSTAATPTSTALTSTAPTSTTATSTPTPSTTPTTTPKPTEPAKSSTAEKEKPRKLERNKSKRENKSDKDKDKDKSEKRSSRIMGAVKGLVNEVTTLGRSASLRMRSNAEN